MGFKFKRSIRVSYERQGYIYFLCRRIGMLPREQQEVLRALCSKAGGANARALWRFLTTSDSATKICMEEYCSQATLYRCVKRFYETFPEKF